MKKKEGKGTHDFRGEREGRGVRGRGDKEEEESKVTKHFADVKVNGKRRSQESRNALPCRRREETDDVDEDDEGRLATERSTRERERDDEDEDDEGRSTIEIDERESRLTREERKRNQRLLLFCFCFCLCFFLRVDWEKCSAPKANRPKGLSNEPNGCHIFGSDRIETNIH